MRSDVRIVRGRGRGAHPLTPPAARWVQNLPGDLDQAERRLRKGNPLGRRSQGSGRWRWHCVLASVAGEPDAVMLARPALSVRTLILQCCQSLTFTVRSP